MCLMRIRDRLVLERNGSRRHSVMTWRTEMKCAGVERKACATREGVPLGGRQNALQLSRARSQAKPVKERGRYARCAVNVHRSRTLQDTLARIRTFFKRAALNGKIDHGVFGMWLACWRWRSCTPRPPPMTSQNTLRAAAANRTPRRPYSEGGFRAEILSRLARRRARPAITQPRPPPLLAS
eukprot:353839-Chlamydomonas_euryale.AAC.11